VTRLIAMFDLLTGTKVDLETKFRHVWPCHILEHEDNDMLRPYDRVADPRSKNHPRASRAA
jgi:hypothetical protein